MAASSREGTIVSLQWDAIDLAPTMNRRRAGQTRRAARTDARRFRTEPWNGEYENPEGLSGRWTVFLGEAISFW